VWGVLLNRNPWDYARPDHKLPAAATYELAACNGRRDELHSDATNLNGRDPADLFKPTRRACPPDTYFEIVCLSPPIRIPRRTTTRHDDHAEQTAGD
jgi:hypothetical protein